MNISPVSSMIKSMLFISLMSSPLNSSQTIQPCGMNFPNFYFNSATQLNESHKLAQLSDDKGINMALGLFGTQRNFTPDESSAYECGLSRLFVKTGRKVF